MSNAPKNREGLIWQIATMMMVSEAGAAQILETLEGFGVRVVPVEPTKKMLQAIGFQKEEDNEESYEDLLEKNPFAPGGAS